MMARTPFPPISGCLLLLPLALLLVFAGPGIGSETDEAVVRTFRQRIAEIKQRQETLPADDAGSGTAPRLMGRPALSADSPPPAAREGARKISEPERAAYLIAVQEQLEAMQRRTGEAEDRLAATERQAKVAAALGVAALSLAILALLAAGRGSRTRRQAGSD